MATDKSTPLQQLADAEVMAFRRAEESAAAVSARYYRAWREAYQTARETHDIRESIQIANDAARGTA